MTSTHGWVGLPDTDSDTSGDYVVTTDWGDEVRLNRETNRIIDGVHVVIGLDDIIDRNRAEFYGMIANRVGLGELEDIKYTVHSESSHGRDVELCVHATVLNPEDYVVEGEAEGEDA